MQWAAREAYKAGLCPLPPHEDGSKAPGVPWKRYERERPDKELLKGWYGPRQGIGLVCGKVSGDLEVLDFDEAGMFERFLERAEAWGLRTLVDRVAAGYAEDTPKGGRHLLYRCSAVAGGTKLAVRPKCSDERQHNGDAWQVLIETRGEGNYIIVAPSGGRVHESGKPYVLRRGGVRPHRDDHARGTRQPLRAGAQLRRTGTGIRPPRPRALLPDPRRPRARAGLF